MLRFPLFKITYFRTVVCILIIIALTVVKFLFADSFSQFLNYYESNFTDNTNIEQVFESKPKEDSETKPEVKLTDSDTSSDISLQKLSATVSGFDMCMPVEYKRISSDYGYRYNPVTGNYALHNGLDFSAEQGVEILAAELGTVTKSQYSTDYGYFIRINHGDGLYTIYAHCSELLVEAGEEVEKGDLIALVGSTGQSTGPHLHFQLELDGTTLNPIYYLPIETDA